MVFSSANLFKSLRRWGHGAIGTAHTIYGIYMKLVAFKNKDEVGKSGFEFNKVRDILTTNNLISCRDKCIYKYKYL